MAKEGKERIALLNTESSLKREKSEPVADVSCNDQLTANIKIEDKPPSIKIEPSFADEKKVETECNASNNDRVTESANTVTSQSGDTSADHVTSQSGDTSAAHVTSQSGDTSEVSDRTVDRQSHTVLALPDGSSSESTPQLQRQSSDQMTDEAEHKSSIDGDSQDGCASQDEHSLDETTKTEEDGGELEDLGTMVAMLDELLDDWAQLKVVY